MTWACLCCPVTISNFAKDRFHFRNLPVSKFCFPKAVLPKAHQFTLNFKAFDCLSQFICQEHFSEPSVRPKRFCIVFKRNQCKPLGCQRSKRLEIDFTFSQMQSHMQPYTNICSRPAKQFACWFVFCCGFRALLFEHDHSGVRTCIYRLHYLNSCLWNPTSFVSVIGFSVQKSDRTSVTVCQKNQNGEHPTSA